MDLPLEIQNMILLGQGLFFIEEKKCEKAKLLRISTRIRFGGLRRQILTFTIKMVVTSPLGIWAIVNFMLKWKVFIWPKEYITLRLTQKICL